MSSSPRVVVLRTKSAVERAARAAYLDAIREQVLAATDEDLPFRDKAEVLRVLSRRRAAVTSESTFGKYSMISNAQVDRVWDAIAKLPASCRPKDVDRVFKKVLVNLAIGTGEVAITREKIAEETGLTVPHVSAALGVLVRLGVLFREVERVQGVRGPGRAVFTINPHVAWNGDLDATQAPAAAKRPLPLLKLIEASAS